MVHVGPRPIYRGPVVRGPRFYGPPYRRPFMPMVTGMEIGLMTGMMMNASRPRYYYPPPPRPTVIVVNN